MPTFVVLLRGVNVGRAKRLQMAEFRAALVELGCSKATTLLNSGNAVVEHPRTSSQALGKKVAAAVKNRFGFDVPVVVKSSAEFDAVVSGNKLVTAEDDHSRLLVAFAQTKEGLASLEPLSGLVSPPERFHLQEDAAYLHCAGGILESKVAGALLGKLGHAVTTRNWATILKLQALASQSAT
jgi:uncharacterized protein (DUF1697 family)